MVSITATAAHMRGRRPGMLRVAAGMFGLACSLLATNQAQAATHYRVLTQFPATGQNNDTDNSVGKGTPGFVVTADGTMYGLGALGYAGGTWGGAIYSVSAAGSFSESYRFGSEDGYTNGGYPAPQTSSLVVSDDGSLYGVAYDGGVVGPGYSVPCGTVFKYSPGTGEFTTLHTFYGEQAGDGTYPRALLKGTDGNFYGITTDVAFKITPDGTETILHTFSGSSPTSLVIGADGALYGSQAPGAWDDTEGTIPGDSLFRLGADGSFDILYKFDSSSDGWGIQSLVQDPNGNLYGTASAGGAKDSGTVFRLSAGGAFSVLHTFPASQVDGWSPGPLVLGTDGNLYGATNQGSRNHEGAVFKMSPTGVFTLLHTFDGSYADGSAPTTMVQHGPRAFYGVAGPSNIESTAPAGVFKMVVPIQDDLTGTGRSSLILSASGALSIAPASGTPNTISVSAGYYPVAIGDFNGDGIADILWTSANRDLYVWFGGTGAFSSKFVGTYPAGWSVVGAGDFDGDGMDDLAWINPTTHQFAYWLMNGAVRKGSKTLGYAAGYSPTAVGDYDGDGRADVLWSSAKHDLYVWFSHAQAFTSKFVSNFPAGWKIAGRGDLDGDGKADLVWSTTDGRQWGYWLMDGGTVRSARSFAIPTALSGSHVATVADYDGNGIADVLWSDGYALTLWENQGGCLDFFGCAFSQSVSSMPVSAGQSVFNSGLPVAQ